MRQLSRSACAAGVMGLSLLLTPAARAAAPTHPSISPTGRQYLQLLENFAGWAEQHWNEAEQCYDAKGSGVTWARGNGDVCIVYAVLLSELPEQATFSPRKVKREVMLDHVGRTLRTLCLRNKNCNDPEAPKKRTWGGPTWQAALETEHWVVAAHILRDQLDDRTKALVRQVASAEANAAMKKIPSAKPGNTAADDCCWNAGLLGVVAAIYADEPQAKEWDEWAKRWALNTEARVPDRTSDRLIDGKPLREWLVSTNAHPDLTVENHGFWNLPYQVCYAALSEPIVACQMCGKPIPEAFYAHAREEGENVLKWMLLADGDLLCPQGLDWAERDVQHSWAFTELGTFLDVPWARTAEQRCLSLLTRRQAAFGDGALHANDFGYETDLACCWSYAYLLHKYFHKPAQPGEFEETLGIKVFPHVGTAVCRTPDLISSVSWFRDRQAVMIVPNNQLALGDDASFTAYRADPETFDISGTGCIRLTGDFKPHPLSVQGEPRVERVAGALIVAFTRTLPEVASQWIGYCALPTGQVVVFSQWQALKDIEVAELIDHPFYWVEVPGYLPERTVRSVGKDSWSIDGKLRMQVIGGSGGKVAKASVLGAVRGGPFKAKAGEILQDTVCIYSPEVPGRANHPVRGGILAVTIGNWTVSRTEGGSLMLTHGGT